MPKLTRRLAVGVAGTTAALLTTTGVVLASPRSLGDWPYESSVHEEPGKVLAVVGDIGCEPNTPENAANPPSLRCDTAENGNLQAEYATVTQAENLHPDLVALLGDEQYEVGKLSDFQNSFDKTWGALKFLERPAPGNHEFYAYTKHGDNEAAQNGNGYFSYFNGVDGTGTIRTQGQAGDDTEANQGWYSYNLGNWHIISLNIECNSAAFANDCSTTDQGLLAQETQWLATDLRANGSACTIAYWHQPTFSATTGTATVADPSAPTAASAEGTAADAWWKLLYAAHADLVLNGHEHVYARFQPMNPAGQTDPRHGIRQFTVGTGGEDLDTLSTNPDGSFTNHNVVTGEDNAYGVMKLTLGNGRYTWNFQPSAPGPGATTSALQYSDTGSATCHGPDGHEHG